MEAALVSPSSPSFTEAWLPTVYRLDMKEIAANFDSLYEYLLGKQDVTWTGEKISEQHCWPTNSPQNPFVSESTYPVERDHFGVRGRGYGHGFDEAGPGMGSFGATIGGSRLLGCGSTGLDWHQADTSVLSGEVDGLRIKVSRFHVDSYSHWDRIRMDLTTFSLLVKTDEGDRFSYDSRENPKLAALFDKLSKVSKRSRE